MSSHLKDLLYLAPELLYDNEKQLLSSLSSGNEEALTFIYRKFWDRLFLSAYNVLKDKEACEDIVQEIFIQLWQKKEQLVIRTSLEAYLVSATRYQVFHLIRKGSKRMELFENLEERFSADSADALLCVKETQKTIDVAVDNLPEKCKNIYKLSRENHLSYKQIAEQLQISTKTVENQLTIALKRLRNALGSFILLLLCFFFLLA
ncbi:MAG: RNA polymerase sigma-70 factor [Ferruginibacter sp.]